jgi:Mrp family chromosome partitioning ATPase
MLRMWEERSRIARTMEKIKHKIIVMSGKGGVGKCLRRGTHVITGFGDWVPIESLGTPVVTISEEGHAEVREKKGVQSHLEQVHVLHLRSGRRLGLTWEHLLYTYGQWRPLRELRRGDRLAAIRWLPQPSGPDELSAHEATVLGLLLGDGGLTDGVPGFTNQDETIVGVLRDAVLGIDPALRVVPRGRSRFGYRISGGRRGGPPNAVMTLLRRWKVNLPAHRKYLPAQVFRSSNDKLALVLKGLFSTDGSVYSEKVEFTSTSPELSEGVQRALLRFGIHAVLREHPAHYTLRGEKHPARRAYRILISGGDVLAFAAHVGFWGRKSEVLTAAVARLSARRRNPNLDTLPRDVWKEVEVECARAGLSWAQLSRACGYARVPSESGGRAYLKQGYLDRRVCPSRSTILRIARLLESSRLRAVAESNVFWDEIVRIEDGGTDEVFDIEVDGSHDFIAEGILVHNSTVSANLAVALGKDREVGIVDVDITGPDIPKLLGVEGAKIQGTEGGILPAITYNEVKVMSMAFFLAGRGTDGREAAVIWRGPLKMKAINQMLGEVAWGELDYLIMDLPPGTSDEPLSIAQNIPDADGAIIVTQPQEVSLLDVRKAITFARTLNMPILGIVENMSGFVCPHCGKEVDVFKKGGGEAAANELGLHFLGRLPLDPEIVVGGDAGKPFVIANPESPASKAFWGIVEQIKAQLEGKGSH